MTTYWQAELTGRVQDAEFPQRCTQDEAVQDALDRLATLSDDERQFTTGLVRQWCGDADGAESVGCGVTATL